MAWGPPLPLLLWGLLLHPALAGSHSLWYFYSCLSEPLPGVPQFSIVVYLDDVPIFSYTSESRRAGPRAPWMEKITAEDPQYWERETERSRRWEQVYKANVRIMMEQVNQTGVEVQEGDDEETYEYEVYHGSLSDILSVMYEEKSPPVGVLSGVLIGAVVGVGLLAAAVPFLYRRINMPGPRPGVGDDHQPVPQEETVM